MSEEPKEVFLPWPEFSSKREIDSIVVLLQQHMRVDVITAFKVEDGIFVTYGGAEIADVDLGLLYSHLQEERRASERSQEPQELEWARLERGQMISASLAREIRSPETPLGLEIVFSEELSPEQVAGTLSAVADYFRDCGGLGFEVDFECQSIEGKVPAHV